MVALIEIQVSYAFTTPTYPIQKAPRRIKSTLVQASNNEDDDRSRPNIVKINTHEQYVKFLEEDDRIAIIKFHANWCKSCQRFGVKYKHLAFEEGDRINGETVYHDGKARFAEVEYSASAKLCKSLKVKRLPTIHMYKKGKGKIVDMTTKPSLFHLVVEELNRVIKLGDDVTQVKEVELKGALHKAEKNEEVKIEKVTSNGNMTNASFDVAMKAGSTLVNEIMSLSKEKDIGKNQTKAKNWFHFME